MASHLPGTPEPSSHTSSPHSPKGRQVFTIDTLVRIIIFLIIAAAIIWLLRLLYGVLLPFVVGCLIAYIIEPLVRLNMRILHLRRRLLPTIVTMLEVIVCIGALSALFLPEIINDAHKVGELIQQYANTNPADLPFLPEGLHKFLNTNLDLPTLSEWLSSQKAEKVVSEIANFFSGGIDALGGIVGWAIVILYVLFILINYPTITNGIRSIVPPAYRQTSDAIIDDTSMTMKRYFRTQALISSIVGVIYATGFSIVGLPLGLAVGLFNAVLFMVPYMVYVSLIPVTMLCIVSAIETGTGFWSLWLKCVAVYVVAESIADLWLTPKIMGKSLNLDPAVMLLSLSVWGTLLGLLGMVLALPLTVIVICYYRRYVLHDTSVELPK